MIKVIRNIRFIEGYVLRPIVIRTKPTLYDSWRPLKQRYGGNFLKYQFKHKKSRCAWGKETIYME